MKNKKSNTTRLLKENKWLVTLIAERGKQPNLHQAQELAGRKEAPKQKYSLHVVYEAVKSFPAVLLDFKQVGNCSSAMLALDSVIWRGQGFCTWGQQKYLKA